MNEVEFLGLESHYIMCINPMTLSIYLRTCLLKAPVSTKHDHGYSYWERRCTNLLPLTHGPQKAFEASFAVHQICFRLIAMAVLLGITGVKYNERPQARASISMHQLQEGAV